MSYFEVTMKFTAEVEGKTKRQSAKFLIETETFGDSEQKAFSELANNQRDQVCHAITRSNVTEVLKIGDGEKWWKVSYSQMISDDEGKEKKCKFILLVDADTVADAAARAADHLGDDATINKIDDGKFADVLEYVKATADAPATFRKIENSNPANGQPVEFTMDCEIEREFQQATIIRPPVDPTQGQATHPYEVIDLLDSIGLGSLTLAQIARIQEQAETMATFDEFAQWCLTMYEMKTGDARLVWDFYGDGSDESR